MMPIELTWPPRLAKLPAMIGAFGSVWRRGVAVPLALGVAAIGPGGCVNVTAPDKPIVIELNVNIRQEVIYRLADDAGKTIEQNKDIF